MSYITAYGMNDAWFQCLSAAATYGRLYTVERGSYEGSQRLELDILVVCVYNPSFEPIPIIPDGLGIPSPTSYEYVEDYLHYLMTDDKTTKESYTYGERLSWQIPIVIDMLKKTPNTNQACMAVAMVGDILLVDPPCLRSVKLKVREGHLDMITYWRSWDLWSAFPTNMGGLQLLKKYMADEIGVLDGKMWAISDGAHVYSYAFKWLEARLGRTIDFGRMI